MWAKPSKVKRGGAWCQGWYPESILFYVESKVVFDKVVRPIQTVPNITQDCNPAASYRSACMKDTVFAYTLCGPQGKATCSLTSQDAGRKHLHKEAERTINDRH